MTARERAELNKLTKAWFSGKATKKQMLRQMELSRALKSEQSKEQRREAYARVLQHR